MERFWLAVNVAAWSCWLLLLEWLKDAPLGARVWALPHLPELVAGLEAICCVEVLRMVVGDLRGSWVTGLLLHYTRVVVIATVLPTASEVLARTILVAWAATELCRYPCYVFKGSPFLLRVRSAAPVVTFPLGAGSELVACYFRYQASDGALRSALGFQVLLNVFGSLYTYPNMVARARKAVFPPAPEVVSGVQFPKTSERGDRSTTVTGKAAWRGLAAELGAADVARAIDWEGDWRANYGRHVVAVAEALAGAPVDAAAEACDKTLADLSDAFEFVRDGATTTGLRAALARYDEPKLETFIVQGRGKAGDVAVGALRGAALDAKFDELAAAGELSPDAAATLKKLPKDLALHGRCFVVFGASSEVGPCRRLLERGATVLAVARKNVKKWAALIAYARTTAGTLYVPVALGSGPRGDLDAAVNAGCDVLRDLPEIKTWLAEACFAPLVVGCYTYLDGDRHVRVVAACDAIAQALVARGSARRDMAYAYLGSPGTAHRRPAEAAARADAALAALPAWQRLLVAGRAAVATGAAFDGLLNLQGPNYALAKTMQMWRAAAAKHDHHVVSCPMAPAVRTRSMLKSAARRQTALKGGQRFGATERSPEFASAVMALLLMAHVTDPDNAHASPHAALGGVLDTFARGGALHRAGSGRRPSPDSTAKPAAAAGSCSRRSSGTMFWPARAAAV
ncbi:hypothetical protein SO694_00016353 [Aureococcus anophagefferens]|uniref:very-long-chain (3R)-3-hydroxyacyl-CoA dehydratase n=1 Tax=Aureococcus anophagefferens TaxID=44056 RepID=A0ABR1G306_AURAN